MRVRCECSWAVSLEDCSWFEKGSDAKGTVFAPDARILESAPRSLRVVAHAVDHDSSGMDPVRDVACPFHIGPTHKAMEAILRVVGNVDRVIIIFVGDDG